MTLEDAIKNREDCLKYLEGLGQKASPQNVEAVRWSVRALKFMQSLALTPPNEPLTLEQLRGMDGQASELVAKLLELAARAPEDKRQNLREALAALGNQMRK